MQTALYVLFSMKYHRTACPNDISKACLQTAYWETQQKEKGDEEKTYRQVTRMEKKEQKVKTDYQE